MTNKQRLEKLIQELQEVSSDGWEILSISNYRMTGEDGKKIMIVELELTEQ